MNDGSKVMSDRADALKELQAESEKIEIYGTITGPRVIDCNSGWDKETQPPTEARTVKDCELEIEYWKSRLSDLCNQAWGQVYPDKTDWQYAAQAVRHLMQENDELKAKLRTTPTTREVLEELEVALKENLAKWDKPLLYLHEIHKSIEIVLNNHLIKKD